MIALVLIMLAQYPDLPAYIRSDADIERREVTVEFIYDGDTFRGGDGIDYRLVGINAPEVAHPEHNKLTSEPGGEEATDAMRAFISGRRVTAIIDRAHSLDRFGRTVAVILGDNQDVNIEMLRSGLAEPRYIDLSPMIDEAAFLAAVASTDSSLSRRAATSEDVTVSGHVLAPGDRIRILVGNQTQDFSINPDGEVLIRGLGVIRVAAKTAANATADLDSAIRAKGITVSHITIFYLAPPAKVQRNVVVIGAVKKSGTFPATTLLGAISAAEGFTYEANPIEVRITAGESTTLINTARILAGADRDIVLEGGEVIVVPTLPRILVSGAVSKPNWVTALFLSEAISAAGGPIPEADLEHTEFRTGSETSVRINVQTIFSGKAEDIRLNDRDRITIPIRPRAIVPLVQVYGPVQRPGTTEAFTIADAIREARPDTRADLENVILDRGAGDTSSVNARDIALGHDPDTELKAGDRVLIPRHVESAMDTLQTVTVLGDVKTPGQVPPGTLTQVLAAAGGVTNTARTNAIRVRLPDGRAQSYDLARITSGKQDNPALPPNSTVYVESDEPRRQGMNDLRTFMGIFSTFALLALRLGT
jgi:protein involved in polysaccharide export with SLBB domain/endonuclease YncB( thermonuclease family)